MSDLQKITEQQMDAVGVCSAPDVLSGSTSENKAVFDKMVRQLVAPAYNAAVDAINTINETETGIEAAEEERISAEEGRATAEADRVSAEEARVQAEQERAAAEEQRENAETGYVARAESAAQLSESWAVGGTGTREGENTDNAHYWAQQAQAAAGGGVTSFNNRAGAVIPQSGDYTAKMVGAVSEELVGSPGGVATLDADGKVPASQRPPERETYPPWFNEMEMESGVVPYTGFVEFWCPFSGIPQVLVWSGETLCAAAEVTAFGFQAQAGASFLAVNFTGRSI